jgi:hypothetical protein
MNGHRDCDRCRYYYTDGEYGNNYKCHNPFLMRIREKHKPDPWDCEFCEDKDTTRSDMTDEE